jgi:acyl transferase domain-containing protein
MAGLVVLGAVNGPRNVMLSGAEAAVSALPTALGVEGRRLKIPLASTVMGCVVLPADSEQPLSDPEYWVRQVSSPVLYSTALESSFSTFLKPSVESVPKEIIALEVGPNPVLTNLSKNLGTEFQRFRPNTNLVEQFESKCRSERFCC